MTSRIKLVLLAVFVAAFLTAVVFYLSGTKLYKDYSLRGTFVFENLEEEDTCLFI
ncbi:MAG: hypothetical protein IJF29_00730 [Firmicutes bacterium]|nr:hypothetical protein [Bacillota bacterium]